MFLFLVLNLDDQVTCLKIVPPSLLEVLCLKQLIPALLSLLCLLEQLRVGLAVSGSLFALVNLYQLDFEYQTGIRWDTLSSAGLAIRVLRTENQLSPLAYCHRGYADVPPFDDLSLAYLELEGGVGIDALVKDRIIRGQTTLIKHVHFLTLGWLLSS